MKKMINTERIEGYLYQSDLKERTVENKDSKNFGQTYISGTIDVATDEEALNVIQVHYTYVTPVTNAGKENATYKALKTIIDNSDKSIWLNSGHDAMKLRLTPALALNDFYTSDGELVSAKRNEGGFVNIVTELAPEKERTQFKTDIVITSTSLVEANEERNIPKDYLVVRGAIFNFRNELLPVEFTVREETGLKYFESLEASATNPVFTEVRGKIVAQSVKQTIEEESAFGQAEVRTVSRTVREWEITWARPVEYDFGEADTITAEELKKAMQDREVKLAAEKKRHDDYLASRNGATSFPNANAQVPVGGFNF